MGIRRQLFLLQTATLGIVTAGAIGGWGISLWIGKGARQQAQRLAVERDHLAHMSYDLIGAMPHAGHYLLLNRDELSNLVRNDIAGLRRFRRELDIHLAGLNLVAADQELHRELETIRLLSVQVEQNLLTVDREVRLATQQGRPPNNAVLESVVRNPSIRLIRHHSDLLAGLHDSVDDEHARMEATQARAVRLGVASWVAVLLAAWGTGLLLSWRLGIQLFDPLVQLERLMRQPPQQIGDALSARIFQKAPLEIASLSRSFEALVREVNRLVAQLEEQLRTDTLTTVGNRRHFDAMLDQEWHRGMRSGEPLSLLLIDVDHFKLFNDHYGHIEGDQCLRQVALAIHHQACRSGDVVCRIGGEEFAVLLPGTDRQGAAHVAQDIVESIDALAIEHRSSPVAGWVTVSVGVASCTPDQGRSREHLIARADSALYRRKQRLGRHGVCLADEPGSTNGERADSAAPPDARPV